MPSVKLGESPTPIAEIKVIDADNRLIEWIFDENVVDNSG